MKFPVIHSGFGLGLGIVFLATMTPALADPPPGYYDTADMSSAAALRASVHAIIDDHTRIPYSSGGTDTWNVLELADEDPNNSANVLDVYKNATYTKVGAGNPNYDREHSWPNSYGFPNDGSANYPYTDCHQLFISNSSYNSSRGNTAYATCSTGCSEQTTDFNNGVGGGSGSYPGNSNWRSGAGATGKWETWVGRRGDVARAQFYLDLRYEGGNHGVTGFAEPDLRLTDNTALIAASNTGSNESIAYMGLLTVLLQWNAEDPVDDMERARNDVIFGFQGNRNPFIDHPEWVDCIFGSSCGGNVIPSIPTGLVATPGNAVVDLNWNDNPEGDIDGYNVYRSLSVSGPFSMINGSLVATSNYSDSTVTNEITYYYRVTAVDTDENESAMGITVSATPTAGGSGPPGTPWINEIHYDNISTDTNEGIEIAGPAGMILTGWQIVGYNGNGAAAYSSVSLSGVIPNQQNGFGTLWFPFTGLQNGAPDGIALADPTNTVIQFLSYEGTFVAIGGVAGGMSSTDIVVLEPGTDAVDLSLQLQGTGDEYTDFTWVSPAAHTRGAINNNQMFEADQPVPAVSTWTMIILVMLVLVAGTVVTRRTATC